MIISLKHLQLEEIVGIQFDLIINRPHLEKTWKKIQFAISF